MAATDKPQRRHTQAVIVIHGIGEERPMDTVRSFVDAVLPEPEQGGEKYFSKPDPLSKSFELRKLQNRSQPRTHFFEYYWAYKVEGTNFGHIWSWLSALLLRRPGKVPTQLRPLWWISWLLIVIFFIAGSFGAFANIGPSSLQIPSLFISAFSALLWSLIHLIVLLYIGDAARYLSPDPGNIKLRQAIRTDGVQLLRKIHEQGEYERVIVVGHSLGSVIAYDILKNYWQECCEVYETPTASGQTALAQLEKIGEDLQKGTTGVTLDDYMKAQVDLWKEIRGLGNPWLVTDLITLGSPLAHAALLLASDQGDLQARQRQRELPTDPPEPEIETTNNGERSSYSYRVWEPYGREKNIYLKALHFGALFACTRWTNLYFPAQGGLFGDIVGGPLQPWFGPGIRDIAVRTDHTTRDHTLLAHVSYWVKDSPSTSLALSKLIETLDLGNTDYFN